MFIIRCSVEGGITGSRKSVLKKNGHIQTFNTAYAAQVGARRLNQKMRTTSFWYWADEMKDDMFIIRRSNGDGTSDILTCTFDTQDAAQQEARRLNQAAQPINYPYRTAQFWYWEEELRASR